MPDPEPIPSWEDWLRWALCEIYKTLGGDCKDLEVKLEDRVDTVVAEFVAKGPPQFPSPGARQAFLDLLDDISDHLDKPGGSLDAAHTAALRTLIKDLRDSL